MCNENQIIIYQDDDEITRVSVRFADEDLWLTQNQLAEIYCTTQQNISQHIDNIYKDGELSTEATNKKFLLVRQEGNRQVRRNIDHYNLDMVIALGYRVQSQVATRFRRWATQRLHEYIQKGFAMDDERLKQGGNRYFRELLQRIRDIRSSERNFYQQVTDIYATATDYDPRDEMTKMFFATVQNKLHYAVHENTAAEVIYNRVDSQALKTLCMGTCTCIACVNWPLPLCHEPLDDPSEKAQKEPHGSFEVICSSSEHDIYRVSEKTLVEVPSQTMVALAVPDNWFYTSPLPEQLVLPGFHVGGIRSFRYVRYHNLRVS